MLGWTTPKNLSKRPMIGYEDDKRREGGGSGGKLVAKKRREKRGNEKMPFGETKKKNNKKCSGRNQGAPSSASRDMNRVVLCMDAQPVIQFSLSHLI